MANISRRQSHVPEQTNLSVYYVACASKRSRILTVCCDGIVLATERVTEHFEHINEQIEVLLRSSKSLLNLVKKRISIEKDRVKVLNRLTTSVLEDSKTVVFNGVLGDSWRQIVLHPQQESLHRSKTLTSIEEEVVQPLSVFLLSDLEKRFHQVVQNVRRMMKDYAQQQHHLSKAQDRYYSVCADLENHLLVMYKEYGAVWEPSVGNKLYEKEQVLSRRVDEARSEYSESVHSLNSLQQELTDTKFPQSINSVGEIAEQMLSVVHTALKSFELLQSSFIGNLETQQSLACTEFFLVGEFCKKTLMNDVDVKNLPPPLPVEFIEYSYKDAPLAIQAKKTQYRAMSLLSPAELASRGAMFLGESGKPSSSKTGNGTTTTTKAKGTGLNVSLVKACLEYLDQPLAKKEEGLFRVSGDSSIIKSLHSAFMSPDQNFQDLRSSVMDQMDPNNISGLLKLHLRENPLLTNPILSEVQEKLTSCTPSNITSAVDTILSKCPSLELSILTGIVGLLKEIISSPWKEHNKMTARTLGIACGLSLFPQLDPGQATYLMEYLIQHHEQLESNHSVL